MKQSVEIYGATDVGRRRKNNEDNFVCQFVWGNSHILLAAIDGIGGYEGGEIAAEICRDTLIDYVAGVSSDSRPLDVIKQAVVEANNAIVRAKESDPRLSMMGCVVTAALVDVDNRLLNMAHVGDSRLYSYHNGVLTKLSHDHSLVGFREEIGDLTEEEAMHHPQRNLIERSCGEAIHMFEDHNFIDAAIFPIPDGTTSFIFCSDGLSDMLTSAEISAVLASDTDPRSNVEQLISKANEAGGKDNVTVVIARMDYPVVAETALPADIESVIANKTDHKKYAPKKSKKSAVDGRDKSRKRISKRLKNMLPWILVVVLLGVIVAMVINFYIAENESTKTMVIPEDIVVEADSIINELDTTIAPAPDTIPLTDTIDASLIPTANATL